MAEPVITDDDRLIYTIMVEDNVVGREVSFRVYDTDNDAVRFIQETVILVNNGVIGSEADPFVWTDGGGEANPDWLTDLDPSAFGSSMAVVGTLFLDNILSGHPDNLVAAFSGGELRGVVAPLKVRGIQTYFLTNLR